MTKKLAIDWDETELRLVSANCSGSNVKVTDAALIPIIDGDVAGTLRDAIAQRGLENTETLVAIGRGKAELRELQLPPVPDDELPDMVRFQAIRSFATAGDSATVDYLITKRSDQGVSMLAAAVGPANLKEIDQTCKAATLTTKRVALRPLAAAALYLAKHTSTAGETALIDLLTEDAEIVVARDGKVIFVRTVRMPANGDARAKALVGELRRSLVACGSGGAPDKVILWGRESIHRTDVKTLTDAMGNVEAIDPFDLVDVERGVQSRLPDHVGRLAPLVGLLRSDETDSDRLIDFLNPRERIVEEPNPLLRILMIGVPIAAILLLCFFGYRHLKNLDNKIDALAKANAAMADDVKRANESVARTERIDSFLDGDVNWLNEIRSLTEKMPGSEELIVKSIVANTDFRSGGGTLSILGGVTDQEVIDKFEASVRDPDHQVVGGATSTQPGKYQWRLDEKITVSGDYVRNQRYLGLYPDLAGDAPPDAQETEPAPPVESTEPVETEPASESPPESDLSAPEAESPATEASDKDPPAEVVPPSETAGQPEPNADEEPVATIPEVQS